MPFEAGVYFGMHECQCFVVYLFIDDDGKFAIGFQLKPMTMGILADIGCIHRIDTRKRGNLFSRTVVICN